MVLCTCLTAWKTFSSCESISVNVRICAKFTFSLYPRATISSKAKMREKAWSAISDSSKLLQYSGIWKKKDNKFVFNTCIHRCKKKKKTQSDSLKVKLEVKPTCTYTNQLITEVYTISSKWLVQVQLPNTPKRQHDYSPKRDIYMHASVWIDLYVCACVCNEGCLHAGDCRKVSYLVVHGDLHRGGFALFQVLIMKT